MYSYHRIIIFFLSLTSLASLVFAQSNGDPEKAYVTSATTQQGKSFPQVNKSGNVRVSISAPEAIKVQLDIGGVKYDLFKDNKGVWTGESDAQDQGFHYYQLNIDGAAVPDPGSLYFYGAGRWGSGIEIPADDQGFYELKDVPHGLVSENIYFSELTGKWRRCFVYTPPGYLENSETRFPVLYLQHGSFEDETGWSSQGKANLIIDNLIAEKKAAPMIIVMDNGYASMKQVQSSDGAHAQTSVFEKVLINEVIPMIDKKFRTLKDREHRAIAGLSMGANQTMRILLNNLDKFSSIGGFSGTSNYPSTDLIDPNTFINGAFKNGEVLNEKLKLLFLTSGTKEPSPFPKSIGAFRQLLDQQQIKYVYYESSETAHEWLTWRRSLKEFAAQLFKN